LLLTTSARVAPADARAALMFSPTWRICAACRPADDVAGAVPRQLAGDEDHAPAFYRDHVE